MNLRQKAKRFKRLYEETLRKHTECHVVHEHILPKHYKAQLLISQRDIIDFQDNPQLLKTYAINRILQELEPLVSDHIVTERDSYMDGYRCTLDIWICADEEI